MAKSLCTSAGGLRLVCGETLLVIDQDAAGKLCCPVPGFGIDPADALHKYVVLIPCGDIVATVTGFQNGFCDDCASFNGDVTLAWNENEFCGQWDGERNGIVSCDPFVEDIAVTVQVFYCVFDSPANDTISLRVEGTARIFESGTSNLLQAIGFEAEIDSRPNVAGCSFHDLSSALPDLASYNGTNTCRIGDFTSQANGECDVSNGGLNLQPV